MDKYVAKYFQPILGEKEAEALEAFAKIVESGHFSGDNRQEIARKIVCGEMTIDEVNDLKERKKRVLSEATKIARYEKAVAKLQEKYFGGND